MLWCWITSIVAYSVVLIKFDRCLPMLTITIAVAIPFLAIEAITGPRWVVLACGVEICWLIYGLTAIVDYFTPRSRIIEDRMSWLDRMVAFFGKGCMACHEHSERVLSYFYRRIRWRRPRKGARW